MSKIVAVIFCGLLGGVLAVVLAGVWIFYGGDSAAVVKHSAAELRAMAARKEASRVSATKIQTQQSVVNFILELNKKISNEGSYAGMTGVSLYEGTHDTFKIWIDGDGMQAAEKNTTRIQFFSSLTNTFQQASGERYVQLHLYYGPKHICTLIGTGPGNYKEVGCDV